MALTGMCTGLADRFSLDPLPHETHCRNYRMRYAPLARDDLENGPIAVRIRSARNRYFGLGFVQAE